MTANYNAFSKGRGGGTLVLSSYVDSGPVSTVHPQKYQEFQAPPKIYPILYLDLKKTP